MFKIKKKKDTTKDNTQLLLYLNNIIGSGNDKVMTKEELSDRLGVSKFTVDKWLDGRYPLNSEYADKICEVLSLDRNVFQNISITDHNFILKYSKLSSENKQKIISYINFLSSQQHGNQKKLTK